MSNISRAYLVIGAGVCAALHVAKISPALPVLGLEFGLTELQSGFLISSVQLAGMLLGLLCGSLVELWGLRNSMVAGLVVFVICSVAGSISESSSVLLALRALEGLCFLLVIMPAPALLRQLTVHQSLSKIMGLWGAYMPLGTALSLLLGALIISELNWRAWWLFLAIVTIATAWSVQRFLPAKAPSSQPDKNTPDTILDALHALQKRLKLTLKSTGPWLVALGFGAYGGQWLTIVGFLPSIYAHAGIQGYMAGVMTAVVAAANIIGNVWAGRLLWHKVPAPRLLYIGFSTMAVCAFLAFATLDWQAAWLTWARFGAVVVLSAVGGLIPGTLFALVIPLAPDQNTVSTTVGFMQQLSSTAQFLIPPLVGALADASGGSWKWTWVILCTCCVMGLCTARLCASQLPAPRGRIHSSH